MAKLGYHGGGTVNNTSDTFGTVIGKDNVVGCSRIDKSDTGTYYRYCTSSAFSLKDISCVTYTGDTNLEVVQCGTHSVASGFRSCSNGISSTASGYCASSMGLHSVSIGSQTYSCGKYAVAMGRNACATGNFSISIGSSSLASGSSSVALGDQSVTDSSDSFSVGWQSHASGLVSIAMGAKACTTSSASYSVAIGRCVCSEGSYDFSLGCFGRTIRMKMSNGVGYFNGGTQNSGADYAEMFQSADGKCIPKGRFVSFKEKSDCVCPGCNEIIGVSSVKPTVLGDSAPLEWKCRFLTNEIGERIVGVVQKTDLVFVPKSDVIDPSIQSSILESVPVPNTAENLSMEIVEEKDDGYEIKITYEEEDFMENPEYDPNIKYIPREDRPEWNEIGLVGKLWVCKANPSDEFVVGDYVTSDENGMAVKSEKGLPYSYRVLEVGEKHLKIFFK